jgi:hypothetical protein
LPPFSLSLALSRWEREPLRRVSVICERGVRGAASEFSNHDESDSLSQRERAGVREETYVYLTATIFLKSL